MGKGNGNTRGSRGLIEKGGLYNQNLATTYRWSDDESVRSAEAAETFMRRAIREYAEENRLSYSSESVYQDFSIGNVNSATIRIANGNGAIYYEVQLSTRGYEYGDARNEQISNLKDEIWNMQFSSLADAVKGRDRYIEKINKI